MPQTLLPKILILSSAENDENIATNNGFVARLNDRLQATCQMEWQNYHNVGLEIADGSLRAFVVSTGQDLDTFKAVYFKSYFRYHEQATAIVEALRDRGTPFSGNELKYYIPAYKLSQLARLARSGIRVPHTLYLSLEHYLTRYEEIRFKLGEAFIFKAIDGSTGDDNYLVKSKAQLAEIIAANQGKHFIAQAFIANESDLRVLVVGGNIQLVLERRRADDSTHLNNTSQGASARLLPVDHLSQALQDLSLRAAKLMNRDVAGVDVMLEAGTGTPYILEVNASPQIASGAFQEEKLAIYANYFAELAAK